VHTIVGDRLEEVVEILERIDARHRLSGRRWVIEHIAHATRDTLQRLARLDCLVTTIPVYYLWKGGHWYDPSVGNSVVAMRTMIELGLDPAAATDNIPYNPGYTLWSMCERIRRTDGAVLGGEERLSREQALRSMTVSGARLTFDEDRKGRLLPGHLADLAVFAEDPLKTGAERLKTLESILTMVGGRIVHGDHRA
jgi:predicted amidohydrolase YtcJ